MAADREGVDGHPCPKPIKVWSWLVERLSVKAGDKLFEPFAGSGTTLVACENLNRKCYAIEISPDYCAVILERMQTAFPHLEIRRDDEKTVTSATA
jgi:DNA modification methylase